MFTDVVKGRGDATRWETWTCPNFVISSFNSLQQINFTHQKFLWNVPEAWNAEADVLVNNSTLTLSKSNPCWQHQMRGKNKMNIRVWTPGGSNAPGKSSTFCERLCSIQTNKICSLISSQSSTPTGAQTYTRRQKQTPKPNMPTSGWLPADLVNYTLMWHTNNTRKVKEQVKEGQTHTQAAVK